MQNPLVSIIIPAHNSARWIGATIDSVLRQTYTNWELIVIDDASTDGTGAAVTRSTTLTASSGRNIDIRLIRNETNLGISKSRNLGLREARGTLIAMLDSDDIWLDEHKLERQVEAFENASQNTDSSRPLGVVGTWMTTIDENDATIRKLQFAEDDASIRRTILYKNQIMQSSVLFLKKAAQEVGGYDESLATMEDHDLWLKIGRQYSFMTLPIYALGYRVHAGGITRRKRRQVALDELTVIQRHHRAYPGFVTGMIKGFARLLLSLIQF